MLKNKVLTISLLWMVGMIATADVKAAEDDLDLIAIEDASDTASEVNETLSLSDNLAQKSGKKSVSSVAEKDSDESENWLKSLISSGTTKFFQETPPELKRQKEERQKRALMRQRSNAANFDISGIKLRMNPQEIGEILTKQGYRRLSQKFEIPNFIKWRGEELCRLHGVIGFERLNACSTKLAQENGYQFIEYEVYNRYSTRETIEIYYTSTFTENLSHRIYYKSDIRLSDSKASKNVYINNLKIYDFWRRIDLKYGEPDNTSEVKWGLGGKKPYLHAETGKLELVDPLLKGMDVARMFNEDTRLANTEYYTF